MSKVSWVLVVVITGALSYLGLNLGNELGIRIKENVNVEQSK